MSLDKLRYPSRPTESFDEAPIGSFLPWNKVLQPVLPEWYVEANGQLLNDPSSPLNGEYMSNLNGVSITKNVNFTSGSPTATMTTTKNIYIGATITSGYVSAGTKVLSINSLTTITMTTNALSSGVIESTIGGGVGEAAFPNGDSVYVIKIKLLGKTKLVSGYNINGDFFHSFQEGIPELTDYSVYYDVSSGTYKKSQVVPLKRGSGTFNTTGGAASVVTHDLGSTDYTVYIVPTADAAGYLGEYWVANKTSSQFEVYKSGSAAGITFDWFLIAY